MGEWISNSKEQGQFNPNGDATIGDAVKSNDLKDRDGLTGAFSTIGSTRIHKPNRSYLFRERIRSKGDVYSITTMYTRMLERVCSRLPYDFGNILLKPVLNNNVYVPTGAYTRLK
ncbi:5487_t:CDS:2 [Cetraspora pellucida]|uniref:5487_t:CDS:1 n=1 Tax=Cetraspora pellucida TaxID=1433469 RepID=A0ACA9LYA0_9GLOM|nr:5487_t:CDS:2 [Cetraspora pellucida]